MDVSVYTDETIDFPEKDEWQQELEEEAVQKAREKAENNEKVKEEMRRRIIELEEEQERKFHVSICTKLDITMA